LGLNGGREERALDRIMSSIGVFDVEGVDIVEVVYLRDRRDCRERTDSELRSIRAIFLCF